MHERSNQNKAFKAECGDQEQSMIDSIFFLLFTKSSAFMFLSEVTGVGARSFCKVEGVLPVEEPTSQGEGKFQKLLDVRSEKHTKAGR